MKTAYLVLSDGSVFEGTRFGADGEVAGELVFSTGMVGYVETLTDPNCVGQLVVGTFPLTGNYGVAPADCESDYAAAGFIVRACCDTPSNFRSESTLDAFMKARGIVGISGVDTRELTCLLREKGTLRACICDAVPTAPAFDTPAPTVAGAHHVYPAVGKRRFAVTVLDCGVKRSLMDTLCACGCEVTTVPADTSASAILAAAPDGVVLSDGPENPSPQPARVETVRALLGKVPLLGIGYGHLLVSLAAGGTLTPLHHGHHGANHPVRTADGRRTYITTQHHGLAVDAESLHGTGAVVSFASAHDGSVEGLCYPDKRCETVAFTPDNSGGAHSTAFVYDRFIAQMGGDSHAEG